MFRSGVFSCCIAAVSLQAGWWSETLPPKVERAKRVLEGFDDVVVKALRDYQVPGLAIGIVVDGHIVYTKGFGLRDRERKLPVSAETLFPICSGTKAFTSFALGTLVDEGLLDWDEPVIDLFEEFRLADEYATQHVSVRDLAAHRTGVARHTFMWYNSDLTVPEVLHRLRYLEPACGIRERYQYSDLMYRVLGTVMECALQQSWAEIVSERILQPLGMTQTSFSIQELQQSSNYAFPYVEKEGMLKRMNFRDFSLVAPAGGMNSNVVEMSRWLQLHLNGGKWNQTPLISQSMLRELYAPHIVLSGYPESTEAQVGAYGLGWYIQSFRGRYNVYHDGGGDGFTSSISILPNDGYAVVVLSNKNLTPLPRFLTMAIFDRLLEVPSVDWMQEGLEGVVKMREDEGQEIAKEDITRKRGTRPSHDLEGYAGVYVNPGYGEVEVFFEEGELQARFHGLTYKFGHWHYDVFSVVEESEDTVFSHKGMKFAFRNSSDGEIEELAIPFEPQVSDIVFRRRNQADLMALSYLRRFAGSYEIYSHVIDVVVRNNALCALFPGRPIYELIPAGENEFTVKSMPGYQVRFIVGPDLQIEEVLLIQPYGITLSAKPKE